MWEIIRTATPEIVWAGFKYTIPIAVISFANRVGNRGNHRLGPDIHARGNRVVKALWYLGRAVFTFYVWLFRSTPLLGATLHCFLWVAQPRDSI